MNVNKSNFSSVLPRLWRGKPATCCHAFGVANVFRGQRAVIFTCLMLLLFARSIFAQAILSKAQIDDLKTRWLDTKKNKTILFVGDFEQRKLNPKHPRDKATINTYKRNGKVPIRVTANCAAVLEMKSGKQIWDSYASLSLNFYITDEKGKVVMKRMEKIGKTADRRGLGGYRADLPKPGTYTCVMYVKKNKMLFGKVVTATVKGYK
jgi:hypothetical protein